MRGPIVSSSGTVPIFASGAGALAKAQHQTKSIMRKPHVTCFPRYLASRITRSTVSPTRPGSGPTLSIASCQIALPSRLAIAIPLREARQMSSNISQAK